MQQQSNTDSRYGVISVTGTFTTTWEPPTEEECKKEIIYHLIEISKKKWYHDKSYNKRQVKKYTNYLVEYHDYQNKVFI